MAILVLFEQFSAKFCLNFFTLILSASPNMMHFLSSSAVYARQYYDNISSVPHSFMMHFVRNFRLIMHAYGVRLIAIEEVRNY